MVSIFAEGGGSPFLRWMDSLPGKARVKCIVLIEQLEQRGIEVANPLSDGIFSLTLMADRTRYAILYFFHGQEAIILHGCELEKEVSAADVAVAIERMGRVCACWADHIYQEERSYDSIKG
jgi:putative component of toxin-antitoxin plasmid stabilization module